MIFLACQTMEGQPITVIPEIWEELRDHERKPYAQRLAGRGIDRLAPVGVAAARQVLLDIIEREAAQIKLKDAAHRRRAEVIDALAADRLLFDESPEGERLRRFELACGRGIWRSSDSLRKIRQTTKSPLSVVRCPLPVADAPTEVLDECVSTNEPTAAREIATNEPTEGPLSVVRCPLPVADCPTEALDEPESTNEPTAARENDTNEPTELEENVASDPVSGPLSLDRSPLPSATWGLEAVDEPTAPNEPTREGRRNEDGGRKEAPNEPTAACENVTNEPTREGRRNEDGGRKDAPNEPTAVCENATNEPTEVGENVANDPAGDSLSLVPSPLPGVTWGLEAVDEPNAPNEPATIQNSTNEPTGAGENVTNEPTGAERMPATLEGAIARIRRRREELVRALNEKERRKPRSIVGHGSAHGHTLSAILS